MSQPRPSFSKGVKPACRGPQEKCPHPQAGVVLMYRPLRRCGAAPNLPLPMSSNGMPKVPDQRAKYIYKGHLLASFTRDATPSWFVDRCGPCRAVFLVTFVAGTSPRSVGVKPACTEAKKGIPSRPLGVGVSMKKDKKVG